MQITAELGYWEKQPAAILMPAVPRQSNKDKRYIIFFNQIWKYSEEHYEQLSPQMPPTYESFMAHKALDLYELFDLGIPNSRQLAEVAWLIQDVIEDLKKLPPYSRRKKVIGEAKIVIDGEKMEAEVHA
jgi:hypothetical protein